MPDPSPALLAAARRRTHALDELEAARLELAELIPAEVEAGVRQVDIVKVTGYTREQVRRIAAGRTT